MSLNSTEHLGASCLRRGQGREGVCAVRRSLACFLADTTSGTTIEYGVLAAGLALAIVLALAHLGGEGRTAVRTLLRLRNQ
jgi:Flp pilus assembly pilin Flp